MANISFVIGCVLLCTVLIQGRPETRGFQDARCNNGFQKAASSAVGTIGSMPAGCFTGAYTKCQQFWSAYYAAVPKNPPPPANVMAPDCVTSTFTLG